MKKPILLAPAGNQECLIAAIEAGCDAVYLGGYSFGARNYAGNFSQEELIEAIHYAHTYQVKVFVTMNTVVFENETEQFLKEVEFLHKHNVDAIIIQDLGMVDLVHQTFPTLELHASTQMHIHNLEGVQFAEQLEMKQVVLARETSITELKNIKQHTTMPLEIFVHGALCFSYSGQCYMSKFLGNRSGNRGTCAQCCRLPYRLDQQSEEQYLLSMKDLNTLEQIGQLMDLEIDCLKIEGRMKRPEYVFQVTALYRKAIDQYAADQHSTITKEDLLNLQKIFNRKFTEGYLFHADNVTNSYRPNHLGIPIGTVSHYKNNMVTVKLTAPVNQQDGVRILTETNDYGCTINKLYHQGKLTNHAEPGELVQFPLKNATVKVGDEVRKTTDYQQLQTIQHQIKARTRKHNIHATVIAKVGQQLQLILETPPYKVTVTSSDPIEQATNQPVTEQRIQQQVNKLGSTPFHITKWTMDCDNFLFIPIKTLSELRREAIEQLLEQIKAPKPVKRGHYERIVPTFDKHFQVNCEVHDLSLYEQIKELDLQKIYTTNQEILDQGDPRVYHKISRVQIHPCTNLDPILVGDLGTFFKNAKTNPKIDTDFSFNVTNSYTVALLHSLGAKQITLSYDLNDQQIAEVTQAYTTRYHAFPNVEKISYGYLEAMITKQNLLKNRTTGTITNQENHSFPVEKQDDSTIIYHYEKRKDLTTKKEYDHAVFQIRFGIKDLEDCIQIKNYFTNR